MTPQQKLRQIVENARGDNLERARLAFGGMTSAQLDEQHGQSGKTRRQILKGYEDERASYEAARALVESL